MSFLLSLIGTILLIAAVACIAFGVFMATGSKTRETGKFFALWWVPGAAAASGIALRDIVTFAIGSVCFCIAGAVFLFQSRRTRSAKVARSQERRARRDSEHEADESLRRGYRRRAS